MGIKNVRVFLDRDREIYKRRLSGETLASIGKDYDINRERVRQICNREKRLLKRND